MWVRGLKHKAAYTLIEAMEVAPYVGAWIETFRFSVLGRVLLVAPYVGAWIETPLLR